ncbi:MFS transporter [Arthrobacter sp. StoSoilB13]|uniref:MFS transporter n=1 Tax=Arthrobacter sp. StoSoilB13 TaxID=2830993 RepID=UPI001CC79CA5|nr:MFS transporter [Arthrobacter sp. StoSoilB13]BCW49716.1 MFS transporter [Arthrobacter sp. StoSoilB13]
MNPPHTTHASKAPTKTSPWTAASASTIGSVLEYYDFFVYGPMAALVFGAVFFPSGDPGLAAVLSLSTFAVGFVARPLGGIVIGHLGDRVGRKKMLLFTFFLTGFVTVGIGLLPTYSQVGVWAPIMLVSLRFLQGIGLGGEWGGAALLAVEHAPEAKRGFFGSLVQAGAPIGVILSSGVVAILTGTLSRADLLAWGWRIPFLLSTVLVIFGLILRLKITETPDFEKTVATPAAKEKLPLVVALRRYPKQILAMIGVHVSDTTLGFMQGVFIIGFATTTLGISPTVALMANIASSITNLIITPVSGIISDRFGPRRVLVTATVALALWAFPMFWLMETKSVLALFVVMSANGLIVGMLFSQQATLFAAVLDPKVRYTGMSIGFQVATVIGGGFGPLIAQALQNNAGGATWSISGYLMLVALVALGCALYLTSRKTQVVHASQASPASVAASQL